MVESDTNKEPATPANFCEISTSSKSPRQRQLKKREEDKKYNDGYDSDGAQGPFFDAIDIEGE